ncbi:MAG: indolepyruvate ferredoxin oxidoreductase subunit alpha [Clostridiales bacterium]|nr:indolepyruvate ferredoxin oxidoreductase subunit alpha [Clostridiales bacterium]
MKELMLGNKAVARGLYEAGVRLVSSYPGTPSTEITEYAAEYDEIYAEWAPNEKVALEVALGAAVGGGRAFCAMKHVGLNVAADPLFISAYTGVNAGLVIGVADDPGMHSSQNEQDSRHYAIAAKLPMLEPSDSSECLEFVKIAYDLSEEFDTTFILRTSTRIAHSQSIVTTNPRIEHPIRDYKKDPSKYVMMPSNARGRHVVVEERLKALTDYAEKSPLNRIERGRDNKLGVIVAGTTYNYAKECFGDSVSYLKLGIVNPLPPKLLADFAASVERVIVIEELDDIIESYCKKIGLKVEGKNLLPNIGEFSAELIAERVLGKKTEAISLDDEIPVRPPVLCPGCPHRGTFSVLKKLRLIVSGDIGCYTLGAAPPLSTMDTTFCMGASVSALHGFNKIRNEANKTVAVIGDSTFMHSGITGLLNITYNKGNATVVIVDNSITGMTGHQQNPSTGYTLKGEPAPLISTEKICAAAGVDPAHIRVADPYDMDALEQVLREELAFDGPSVVIARRPCALLKYVKREPALTVDPEKCKSCRACMSIGCPSISFIDNKAVIDPSLCVGCRMCASKCRFDAIN